MGSAGLRRRGGVLSGPGPQDKSNAGRRFSHDASAARHTTCHTLQSGTANEIAINKDSAQFYQTVDPIQRPCVVTRM